MTQGLGTVRSPGSAVRSVCNHLMDQVAERVGERDRGEAVDVGTSPLVYNSEVTQADRLAASLGMPPQELAVETTHAERVHASLGRPLLASPLRTPQAEQTQPLMHPRSPQGSFASSLS